MLLFRNLRLLDPRWTEARGDYEHWPRDDSAACVQAIHEATYLQ